MVLSFDSSAWCCVISGWVSHQGSLAILNSSLNSRQSSQAAWSEGGLKRSILDHFKVYWRQKVIYLGTHPKTAGITITRLQLSWVMLARRDTFIGRSWQNWQQDYSWVMLARCDTFIGRSWQNWQWSIFIDPGGRNRVGRALRTVAPWVSTYLAHPGFWIVCCFWFWITSCSLWVMFWYSQETWYSMNSIPKCASVTLRHPPVIHGLQAGTHPHPHCLSLRWHHLPSRTARTN